MHSTSTAPSVTTCLKTERLNSPTKHGIINATLPDTVNPASRVVGYTPKAAIFDFYTDVKMIVEPNGHEVVIGKCATCNQTIRGSRNVTSNFVTHVKRLHPERQSDWERKKAERHGYFPKNYPTPMAGYNMNMNNLYGSFTIPTQVKLQTTPSTMLCYDTTSNSSCYGNTIVTQDSFLVTQDSTLTTTVKQEMDETKYVAMAIPSTSTIDHRPRVSVASPDSVTDNEMWALLQAKQMLLFLVEQFLPLETADSPALTTLLSQAPQKPYSSSLLQNVLMPTCVTHVTSSITCTLQNIRSVNIVITTQRKKHNSILFAVSVHFVNKDWKQACFLLSMKYHATVQQFECSFLDILVKHSIENKVFTIISTDMTYSSNFSLFDIPEIPEVQNPVLLPSTLAGIVVEPCEPLPNATSDMILAGLNKWEHLSDLREELNTNTFPIKYDTESPKWSSEQAQILSELPLITEILSVLEPFKEIFDLLKSNQLLISVALPSILSLIKLLEQKPSTVLTALLLEELRCHLDKINSSSLFRTATFLDPRFKLTWCKDKEDESKVVGELRTICVDTNEKENNGTKMKLDGEQPESKRIKLFTYFSNSSSDTDQFDFTPFSPLDKEIKEYLQLSVSDETTDPLEYWRDNSANFKLLSKTAGKLLSVPIVHTRVQSHLSRFEKRIESLEAVSTSQSEEYLYLKLNESLW